MLAEMIAEPPLTDDERYDALARRDASLRDAFVIAVKTTGIYCRPGCPARAPKRENVRFFPTTDEARAEGFRACLRCKPDEARPRPACRPSTSTACSRPAPASRPRPTPARSATAAPRRRWTAARA